MADFTYVAIRALDAYEVGACNARALSRALVEAVDVACEVEGGNSLDTLGGSDGAAPARLILAQLAHILGIGHGDYSEHSHGGVTPMGDVVALTKLRVAERERAEAEGR